MRQHGEALRPAFDVPAQKPAAGALRRQGREGRREEAQAGVPERVFSLEIDMPAESGAEADQNAAPWPEPGEEDDAEQDA
jgi:hypothetical protein